jgi:pyruvate formate lyase activating enzyme
MTRVLDFLAELDRRSIPTRLRRVVIPTLTDSDESVLRLAELAALHPSVVGVELLPFSKLCLSKYEMMAIPFPLKHLPEAKADAVRRLQVMLDARLSELKK